MIKFDNKTISSVYSGEKVIEKIYKGTLQVYESWRNLIASGVPPLTLLNCKGVNLVDYKIYGESVQAILPSEYQQVEYIESTGTQYIDTEVLTTHNLKFEIDMSIPIAPTGGEYLCGSNSNIDGSINEINIFLGKTMLGNVKFQKGNNSTNNLTYQMTIGTRYKIVADKNGRSIYNANGTLVKANTNVCNEEISAYNFNLFNRSISNGTVGNICAQLYSCKLWENGVLVRNFIPSYHKSDNAIGLYDLVNNVFYKNKGTGEFIKGDNVMGTPTPDTPIEVESVGEKTINLFDVEQFEAELRKGYILNDDGVETQDSISSYSTYKIPINKGETIFIEGMFQRYYIYDIDKNLISRSPAKNSRISIAYTPTVDGYIGFQIKSILWNSNKGTEQVHLGSTTTDYEPYGKYKIPFKVSGRNLFDKDNISRTISNATIIEENNDVFIIQGNEGLSALANSAGQILLETPNSYEANKTYTFSIYMTLLEAGKWDGINQILFGTSRSDYSKDIYRNRGDQNSIIGIRKQYSFTFTPDYDLKTIVFRLNGGKWNIEWNTLQLEQYSEVTDYEPYHEPITTNIYLDEPLRKLGDYVDYIDFINKKVVRNVEVIDGKILQGLETPIEETIELPNIPTIKGTTILEVDTKVQPSNLEVVYKGK